MGSKRKPGHAAHAIAKIMLKHATRTCKTGDDPARGATAILNLSKLVEALVRLAVWRRLQLKGELLQANGSSLTKDLPKDTNLGGQLAQAHGDVVDLMDEFGLPKTEL